MKTPVRQWTVNSLAELDECAAMLSELLPPKAIVCVKGEMGAGKTTLIRGLCEALGVVDEVSSPTYALVNTYRRGSGETIYHFDLYRIDDPEEALDIGIEEYFDDQTALKLIEWPERISGYLPEDAVIISILMNPDGSRTISLRA